MLKKIAIIVILVVSSSCDRIIGPEDPIDPHGIFFSDDGNIYKMNYDGSDKIQLTFDDEDNNNPKISVDGTLLINETQAYTFRYPSGGLMYDWSVISIMDLKTRKVREIADENEWCTQPALSPDQQFLVFCTHQFRGGAAIVVTDIEGKEFKTLTDYGRHQNPMFTAQGDEIIYTADHGEQTELFIIGRDGGNKRQLTNSGWNINPAVSPDGSKIVGESYRDIFLMNLDGSNKINLTNDPAFDRNPSFSHDGQKIVFIAESTYNVPIEQSVREIHILDLETNERKIVLRSGANFEPKFFPDADRIYFAQYENFQFYLCSINVDGTGYRRLGRGGNAFVF
jgi:TolB protein